MCVNVLLLCAFRLCAFLKGQCVGEGPEVRCTPESGQGQSRISDPSSRPSSLALCCHGMSPWVTVFPGQRKPCEEAALLRSEGDAERLVEGGEEGVVVGGGGGVGTK